MPSSARAARNWAAMIISQVPTLKLQYQN